MAKQKFAQIDIFYALNAADANKTLRAWQISYPQRRIISISSGSPPQDIGWFITITYEIEV